MRDFKLILAFESGGENWKAVNQLLVCSLKLSEIIHIIGSKMLHLLFKSSYVYRSMIASFELSFCSNAIESCGASRRF